MTGSHHGEWDGGPGPLFIKEAEVVRIEVETDKDLERDKEKKEQRD